MSAPTAWLRTEGSLAIVCAWCADQAAAEARAHRAGLSCSHTICPQCAAQFASEVTFEAGERCAASNPETGSAARGSAQGVPARLVTFSDRTGGRRS